MAIPLPIGHLLLLVSSRNKTMSPILKFATIFFLYDGLPRLHKLPSSQFHLLSVARASTVSYNICPLSGTLLGGIITFDFIVSNCIGNNGTGLRTSGKDSNVIGLVLTIASTSARNVQSDSSFRPVLCNFSSATKIELADLIWCSDTLPILLAVGGFLFHWIH